MVPIYAIASFISLFSLQAAFFNDVIRDIYEVSYEQPFFVTLPRVRGVVGEVNGPGRCPWGQIVEGHSSGSLPLGEAPRENWRLGLVRSCG